MDKRLSGTAYWCSTLASLSYAALEKLESFKSSCLSEASPLAHLSLLVFALLTGV